MPKIQFYFDYESPNAYIAWVELPKLAQRYGFDVEPIPVLYAALLDANGQLGPGEQPTKGIWMAKNLARKAAVLGLELNSPAFLPFNPLRALRVSILPFEEPVRAELITALFEAIWVRGMHVSEPGVVEGVLDELGLPGAELVERAHTPEVKAELRAQTDRAIAKGVFGVPTMIVGEELFWGYDDFPYLELVLAGRDPIDAARMWGGGRREGVVRASSMRRKFRSEGSTDG
jgi:2-hydroxychromene-2-carboxylate isomerase